MCPAVPSVSGPSAITRKSRLDPMAYDIDLAPVFPPLTPIDVGAFAAEHEPWTNRTLATVGESVVRMGVLEGEFHWHHHDVEDELFLVLEGELLIDLRDRDDPVVLGPHQAFMVPHGVEHRPRPPPPRSRHNAVVPMKANMNAGCSAVTLSSCIARMPWAAGRPSRPGMTNVE